MIFIPHFAGDVISKRGHRKIIFKSLTFAVYASSFLSKDDDVSRMKMMFPEWQQFLTGINGLTPKQNWNENTYSALWPLVS